MLVDVDPGLIDIAVNESEGVANGIEQPHLPRKHDNKTQEEV